MKDNKTGWVLCADRLPNVKGEYLVISVKTSNSARTVKKKTIRKLICSSGVYCFSNVGEYIPYWFDSEPIAGFPEDIKNLY